MVVGPLMEELFLRLRQIIFNYKLKQTYFSEYSGLNWPLQFSFARHGAGKKPCFRAIYFDTLKDRPHNLWTVQHNYQKKFFNSLTTFSQQLFKIHFMLKINYFYEKGRIQDKVRIMQMGLTVKSWKGNKKNTIEN